MNESGLYLKRWLKQETIGFKSAVMFGGNQKRIKHFQTDLKLYFPVTSQFPTVQTPAVAVIVDGLSELTKTKGSNFIAALKRQFDKIIIFHTDNYDSKWNEQDFVRKQFDVYRFENYHAVFNTEGDGLFCVWEIVKADSVKTEESDHTLLKGCYGNY